MTIDDNVSHYDSQQLLHEPLNLPQNEDILQLILTSLPFNQEHSHCYTCYQPVRCGQELFTCPSIWGYDELYSKFFNVKYNCQQINKICEENSIERCPVVQCVNAGCTIITHCCKLKEHFLICPYQKVPCLNSYYGCPYMMIRKNISSHLKHCPASVIHCSHEWKRWPLFTKDKSSASRVFCSPHALDINNLDVALALRDQRMLKQLWSASRQTKRIMRGISSSNPAVPFKPYMGIRTYREYTTSSLDGESKTGKALLVHCANIDEEKYLNYAAKLVETAYRDSLLVLLKRSASHYRKIYNDSQQLCHQQRKKSNSICQMLSTDFQPLELLNKQQNSLVSNENCPPLVVLPLSSSLSASPSMPFSMPSSTSINLPILTDLEKSFLSPCGYKTTSISPPPPPLPKCNMLSLEIKLETTWMFDVKPRSVYTFRCGKDFRRDEISSHSRDIHRNIHAGLDGWIEYRCPLFQYGCSFVQRRWYPCSPSDSGTHSQTFVYNQTQEAFSSTCVSVAPNIDQLSHIDDSKMMLDKDYCDIDETMDEMSKNKANNSLSCQRNRQSTNLSPTSNSSLSLSLSGSAVSFMSCSSATSFSSSKFNLSLNDIPYEIMEHICSYLDGFSLNNLSLTSRRLRFLVQSFVKKQGYVTFQWKRFEIENGKYEWRIAYKKWSFSTAFQPVQDWSLDATNVMAKHLQVCPFNERIEHTEPVRVIFD